MVDWYSVVRSKTRESVHQSLKLTFNMSKRLWTETRQVGAKNSAQKSSKTKAKLSQAERFGKGLVKV